MPPGLRVFIGQTSKESARDSQESEARAEAWAGVSGLLNRPGSRGTRGPGGGGTCSWALHARPGLTPGPQPQPRLGRGEGCLPGARKPSNPQPQPAQSGSPGAGRALGALGGASVQPATWQPAHAASRGPRPALLHGDFPGGSDAGRQPEPRGGDLRLALPALPPPPPPPARCPLTQLLREAWAGDAPIAPGQAKPCRPPPQPPPHPGRAPA